MINHKTEINFDQNRKRKAKSEKICTRLRSLRLIFSEDKQEKYKTASNSKFIFAETASEIEQKLETAIVNKTEKPKFFGTETEKPI